MPPIATILRFAPWAIALAGILGALYFRSDAADARAAKAQYEAAIAERIADNNARVLEEIQKLGAKADEATARELARERAAKAATATRLSEIDHAPAASDGPVAPVLRDALRSGRLR